MKSNSAVYVVTGAMVVAACSGALGTRAAWGQSNPPASIQLRDGSRDFDVLVGNWKATLKRLDKPLSGSTTWTDYEGTQITRNVWAGRASLTEFSVRNKATGAAVEGLTLRLYNPETRQWSLYWANAKKGILELPPVVGEFRNGRGEFYDQEMYEGRAIFVRYVWSEITPTSAHFEQSFRRTVARPGRPTGSPR